MAVRALTTRGDRQRQQHRLFWACLAAPGIIWLTLLFIVPFYAVLAIAGGRLNQLFGTPIAVWNPLQWSFTNLRGAWRDIAGSSAFIGPIILRTIWYTAAASVLCLIIGYPAAYFVARFGGRSEGAVPGAADRPVLDQLHDAHARLDRPAADERVRQQGADVPAPGRSSDQLAGRAVGRP